MSWLRWRQGRTSPNNYQKMLLLALPGVFDLYVLRFKTGSSIDWHRDPVTRGLAHHRINWTLRKASKGGQVMTKMLVFDGERRGAVKLTLKHKKRLTYMRPDLTEHSLSKVEDGCCLVLSFGWVSKEKSSSRRS